MLIRTRLTPHTGYDFTSVLHNDTYPAISSVGSSQKGRTVFISGASKGIGRATAISYAQAGASGIVIGARSPLDEVTSAILAAAERAGHAVPRVVEIQLDVSDEKSVTAAVAQVETALGRLDILINNAGRLEPWLPLADTDPTSWWSTWEVNVKGTYLMTRAFLPLLLRGGEKTIINMGSMGAHLTRPGASAYQTGKLALLRLTEFTAVEYGAQGLLAWYIHPGAVPTELASNMPADTVAKLVDTPELAGDSIAWLTRERQTWLSGRYVSASWDMEELLSKKDEIVEGNKLKVRLAL